jgi:hypothetical protein
MLVLCSPNTLGKVVEAGTVKELIVKATPIMIQPANLSHNHLWPIFDRSNNKWIGHLARQDGEVTFRSVEAK